MRGVAIAAFVFAIAGVFYLVLSFGGFVRANIPLPSAIVPYMHAIYQIVAFGPPLLGFGFGVLALLAPVFGRKRAGAIYAILGIGLSLPLLAFWSALRSGGGWH